MDKNAIKKFAVETRKEMIRRVALRAAQFGITPDSVGDPNAETVSGHILSQTEFQQRHALIENIRQRGYDQVIEEVAYTWFNRFIALRFMEVNGYLPSHVRVFTNNAGEFKPQILDEAIDLPIDGLDSEKVLKLKNTNKDEELYKYLLIVQCNALNSILPGMFQRISDYTELLFPDNLLRTGSPVEEMVTAIPEEDWKDQVQIIGWLYQFYNSELKDKVYADLRKNKIKITKETIPAATQLFTPDWIVRYMVENSLGRLWQEGHPNDALKSTWKYYLDEAPQEPEVEAKLAEIRKECADLTPEEIHVIDPCMGSGHILCVLFDILVQIYEDYGYSAREAAATIVEKNLWGLDIDERASQLAYFAVMMKGRQYDGQFFGRNVQPHVYAINETNVLRADYEAARKDISLPKEHLEALDYLMDVFLDAKEYGSILQLEKHDYEGLKEAWLSTEAKGSKPTLWYETIAHAITQLIDQAISLSQEYHIVVTNPPYAKWNSLKLTVNKHKNKFDLFPDLYVSFIFRCASFLNPLGLSGMITQTGFLFKAQFKSSRKFFLESIQPCSMLRLGPGVFENIQGEVVQSTSFIFRLKRTDQYKFYYYDLFNAKGSSEKEGAFIQNKQAPQIITTIISEVGNDYLILSSDESEDSLLLVEPKIGCQPGSELISLWWEHLFGDTTYKPYNKGGVYRKWYGNQYWVLKYGTDGSVVKNNGGQCSNEKYYGKAHISWTRVSSRLNMRYYPRGFYFDNTAPAIFENQEFCLGFYNSKVCEFNRLTTYGGNKIEAGYIKALAPIAVDDNLETKIRMLVSNNIDLSKNDWDSFEISCDFQHHPLTRRNVSAIADAYNLWKSECDDRFNLLKNNEEDINQIFIDFYGLQDELTPEVEDKDVTVRKADLNRDIRSFISYAVGCMFGRYSLDQTGLAYAGGDMDTEKYKTFLPDNDNIIPVCDDEYFTDDIVCRFIKFVEIVYGKETLEENLRFIADALGGKGTAREVIRRYFLNDFFTDHCKIYQKRPIYWLFDSGKKNAFRCLVYMHRYQPDLVARIRTDYIHPQQSRYRSALADLDHRIAGAPTAQRVKLEKERAKLQDQADELLDYEAKIHHLANQMIDIDLDDGVKVNYAKFQAVLAKIK